MIAADRLTVRYGHTIAVDGADLVAPTAGTLGLIGPNGSGKSTMLRAILSAIRRDGGRVVVDGEQIEQLTPRQRAERIAVVSQEEPSGLPLTAWDSVLLGRSPRLPGWSRYRDADELAAAAAMERAGVAHLAHRSTDELSGGERQRVLIARSLAQEASHLLLDEPTNHLDIRHQLELLELLRTLDLTCIIALHDLNLAARYCDHLVILDHGTVAAAGTPETVLTAELIRDVYEVDALIDHDPATHALRVTYLGTPRPPLPA